MQISALDESHEKSMKQLSLDRCSIINSSNNDMSNSGSDDNDEGCRADKNNYNNKNENDCNDNNGSNKNVNGDDDNDKTSNNENADTLIKSDKTKKSDLQLNLTNNESEQGTGTRSSSRGPALGYVKTRGDDTWRGDRGDKEWSDADQAIFSKVSEG